MPDTKEHQLVVQMHKPYENCDLWQKTFSKTGDELKDREASKLATIYADVWDKACSIAAKIAQDAPGLTLHDERHFVALWKSAGLVIGDNRQNIHGQLRQVRFPNSTVEFFAKMLKFIEEL